MIRNIVCIQSINEEEKEKNYVKINPKKINELVVIKRLLCYGIYVFNSNSKCTSNLMLKNDTRKNHKDVMTHPLTSIPQTRIENPLEKMCISFRTVKQNKKKLL